MPDAFIQMLREGYLGENTEVGCIQKAQPSLSLSLPKISIRVDDPIS